MSMNGYRLMIEDTDRTDKNQTQKKRNSKQKLSHRHVQTEQREQRGDVNSKDTGYRPTAP